MDKNFVIVPVFFNGENSESLMAIYGYVPLEKSEIKDMYFFRKPDAVYSDTDYSGMKFTGICINGQTYCSPLNLTKLIEIFNSLKNEQ